MIHLTIQLEEETCITCGCIYALPAELKKRKKKDHTEIFCPSGHGQHYTGESEEEKLRRQLTNALARESNLSGELNRIKNRVKNGVCPCCNRSFQNLAKHMKTKHKDFVGK